LADLLDERQRKALKASSDMLAGSAITLGIISCAVPLMDLGMIMWAWGAWTLGGVKPRYEGELAARGSSVRTTVILLAIATLPIAALDLSGDSLQERFSHLPALTNTAATSGVIGIHAFFFWLCARATCRRLELLARALPAPRVARGFHRCKLAAPIAAIGLGGWHALVTQHLWEQSWVPVPLMFGFLIVGCLAMLQFAATLTHWRYALADLP
jgi:hypothetical protein